MKLFPLFCGVGLRMMVYMDDLVIFTEVVAGDFEAAAAASSRFSLPLW